MGWIRRLRATLRPAATDAAFDEETRFHLESLADEYVRRGMSVEEAQRAARRRLGNLAAARERTRDADGLPWLRDSGGDLRFASRSWRRTPGVAAVAVITLALGIGAATAVFSVVEAVLIEPLPYHDVDRLVAVWDGHIRDASLAKIFASFEDFDTWRRHSASFEALAAATWATGDQILTGAGDAKIVLAIPASVELFAVLGVPAAIGRTFEPADLSRGCTVVLADRFWRNTLGSRAGVVGRSLALDDRACTVAGVMPARFAFFPEAADMWRLITPNREQLRPDGYQGVGVFGRLRRGVSLAQAQAELSALHRTQHAHDEHGAALAPTVYPLQAEFTWLAGRNLRLTLWTLFGAVAALLLIACVNVANLLLGRALVRQREFAIRAALGSGRWRVARQVLAEALLLAACAGLLGILVAEGAVGYLRAFAPIELPPGVVLAVNGRVLAFAVLTAMTTAVVFGMLPAWRASHADISAALQSSGRTVAGHARASRIGRTLVAVQIACAMVLLVGAGLLAESIVRLGSAPLGFDPDGLLTMTVRLPRTKYADADRRVDFYRRLVGAARLLPGVDGVALSTTFLRGHGNSALTIEGHPAPVLETSAPDVGEDFVSPSYFTVSGVSMISGRVFDDRDRREGESVCVVNEALARKYFPGADPIGQRIRTMTSPWTTIVAVVGNQKSMNVMHEMRWVESPFVYRPLADGAPPEATLLLRASTPGAGEATQRAVAALDPAVPVANVQTMRARLAKDLAYPQFRAVVLGIFAAIALLLAGVGLYAVVSQLVAQRTHEFGVRMSLGATAASIVRLVALQGGAPALAGVAAGVAATLALERVIASLLYGIDAAGAATLVRVGALLVVMAFAAMLVPAVRATKIDPLAAIRSE